MSKTVALKETRVSESNSWRQRLLNAAGFQAGWLACVMGAAADNPWIGPVFVGLLTSLNLVFLPFRMLQLRLIVFAALLGTGLDGILILSNIFTFSGSALPPWLSPLWLTAMWINFALTLRVSMSWLLDRYGLGAVMGGIGGPAAYYAGARFGAIDFQTPLPVSLLLIAVMWSGALPLLLYVARKDRS